MYVVALIIPLGIEVPIDNQIRAWTILADQRFASA